MSRWQWNITMIRIEYDDGEEWSITMVGNGVLQ